MNRLSGLARWGVVIPLLMKTAVCSMPAGDDFLTLAEDAYLGSFMLTAPVASIKKDYKYPGLGVHTSQTTGFGGMSGITDNYSFPRQLYGGFTKAENDLHYGCFIANPEYRVANYSRDSLRLFGIDGGVWRSKSNGRMGYAVFGNVNSSHKSGGFERWSHNMDNGLSGNLSTIALLRLPSRIHSIRISGTGRLNDRNSSSDYFETSSGSSFRKREHGFYGEYLGEADLVRQKQNSAIVLGCFSYIQQDFDSSWSINNTVLSRTLKNVKTFGLGFKGSVEYSAHPADKMEILYGAEYSGTWESLRDYFSPEIRHFLWYYKNRGESDMTLCLPVSLNFQPLKSLLLISSWKIAATNSETHNTNDALTNRSSFYLQYQGAPLSIIWKMKSADIALIPQFSKIVSGLEVRMRW